MKYLVEVPITGKMIFEMVIIYLTHQTRPRMIGLWAPNFS